jgi:glycosyltransferase involved in cell wall biosynthesis
VSDGDRAPRILLACDFHRHYCTMLAGGLERAGAEVVLLTRDHDLEFGGVPGAAMEFTREVVGPGVTVKTLGGRVRSPRDWRRALALRRELKRFRPDVVHLQDSVGNDVRLLFAAGVHRRRFVLTVHDSARHPGDGEFPFVARLNRVLELGAGLIFVHAESVEQELREFISPKLPVVVIPHGIDPGEATPLPQEPSILFFGRISYYKGLDVLLDAMEAIWGQLPAATLTIAGEGEIEPHPALSDPRVTVHAGHVPEADVPALFRAASCVALPYREASQSGVGSRIKPYARPLVVAAVGGLPELVSDGSGIVVPAEDPAALAEALVSVLADRGLATRLGEAGAATAAREGSWDTVAGETLAAYREHLVPRG